MVQIAERASILDQDADRTLLIERANHLWDRQATFGWEMVDVFPCDSSPGSDDDSIDEEEDGLGFNSQIRQDDVANDYTELEPPSALQQSPYAQDLFAHQLDRLANPLWTICLMCNMAFMAVLGTLCDRCSRYSAAYDTGTQQVAYCHYPSSNPLASEVDRPLSPLWSICLMCNMAFIAMLGTLCDRCSRYSAAYNKSELQGTAVSSNYPASEVDREFDSSQTTAEASSHSLADDANYQNTEQPSCPGRGDIASWPGASFDLPCTLDSDLPANLFDEAHTASSAEDPIEPPSRVTAPSHHRRARANLSDATLIRADETVVESRQGSQKGWPEIHDREAVAPEHTQFNVSYAPLQGTAVSAKILLMKEITDSALVFSKYGNLPRPRATRSRQPAKTEESTGLRKRAFFLLQDAGYGVRVHHTSCYGFATRC